MSKELLKIVIFAVGLIMAMPLIMALVVRWSYFVWHWLL